MSTKPVEEEVMKYQNSSKLKIRFMIFVFQILKFMSGDMYFFINSLVSLSTPIILLAYSPFNLILGLFVHYFFFWRYLKPKLDTFLKLKDEIKNIDIGIKILRSYLKNKNPN